MIERIAPFVEWKDGKKHTQEIFRYPDGRVSRISMLDKQGKVLNSTVMGYDKEGKLDWTWSDSGFIEETLNEYTYQEIDGYQIAIETTYFQNDEGEWAINHAGVAADVFVPHQRDTAPQFIFLERSEPGWLESMPYILDGWKIPYTVSPDGASIFSGFMHGDQYIDSNGNKTYLKSLIAAASDGSLYTGGMSNRSPIRPVSLPVLPTPRPATIAKVARISS